LRIDIGNSVGALQNAVLTELSALRLKALVENDRLLEIYSLNRLAKSVQLR